MKFKPPRFDFYKFVPRVVRADEPGDTRLPDDVLAAKGAGEMAIADDLELPDDLAMLAEQLGADAEYLAARYPADATDRAVRPAAARSTSSRSHLAWSSVAAMALIAAGAWSGIEFFERQQAVPFVTAELAAPRVAQPTATADAETESMPATPAMFFQDLSGPEQEGLLDLFEEQSLPQSSLSI